MFSLQARYFHLQHRLFGGSNFVYWMIFIILAVFLLENRGSKTLYCTALIYEMALKHYKP